MRLAKKVALVTGATGAIGSSITRLFAREGAAIILLGRDKNKLESLSNEISKNYSVDALPIKTNITVEEEIQAAINLALNRFDRIDILINNAGFTNDPIEFHKTTDDLWNELINTNLIGTFRVTRSVLPFMMERRYGSIVNVSSVAGMRAIEKVPLAVYNSTKAGIIMFSKSIALEYAEYNIRCNVVCPGTVRSKFLEPYLEDEEARKILNSTQPLGRIGEPEDVANAILYLASDEANWVTGSVLVIDGGLSTK
ncbi:MAG: SDR family oxidoreductase [Candidatus Nitrosocaldaceae archaeon]